MAVTRFRSVSTDDTMLFSELTLRSDEFDRMVDDDSADDSSLDAALAMPCVCCGWLWCSSSDFVNFALLDLLTSGRRALLLEDALPLLNSSRAEEPPPPKLTVVRCIVFWPPAAAVLGEVNMMGELNELLVFLNMEGRGLMASRARGGDLGVRGVSGWVLGVC